MVKNIRAIVLDPETMEVRFPKIKIGKSTVGGKIIVIEKSKNNGDAFLLPAGQTYTRERRWRRSVKYVPIKKGDPRVLRLSDEGIEPSPMDAEIFHLAIKSSIASNFLRGPSDVRNTLIIVLAIVVVALGVALAYTGG